MSSCVVPILLVPKKDGTSVKSKLKIKNLIIIY